MFEANESSESTGPGGYKGDPPMLVNGVIKSVTGLSGIVLPLSEEMGSCGLEEIFCLRLSTRFGFDCPLESPTTSESGFEVGVNRFLSVSLGSSGVEVGPRDGVDPGTGTGTVAGAGDGVGLGADICVGPGFCADADAGFGSRAGVGTGSGLNGTGGGETKAVLSASSLARACAAASLSAFCCFKMRSTDRPS